MSGFCPILKMCTEHCHALGLQRDHAELGANLSAQVAAGGMNNDERSKSARTARTREK
jgi:hypothetical protein